MLRYSLLLFLTLPLFPLEVFGRVESNQGKTSGIAARYAPVVYQEVDRGSRFRGGTTRAREDYIVAVDFDGDWISANNWENFEHHDLQPTLYYSVLETKTHFYISYAVYHPRDWNRYPTPRWFKPYTEHENDMENLQVVVEKRGGRVQLLATQAHQFVKFASAVGETHRTKVPLRFSEESIVLINDKGRVDPDGTHVAVFIERKGHGIYSLGDHRKVRPVVQENQVTAITKIRDGVRFREQSSFVEYRCGVVAREPTVHLRKGRDVRREYNVPYELACVYETFWKPFEAVVGNGTWPLCGDGQLFDTYFGFENERFSFDQVPRHFDSDQWSGPAKRDAGISPFAIGLCTNPVVPAARSRLGAFFFDPARAYASCFLFPAPVSEHYLHNPYLVSPLNRKADR